MNTFELLFELNDNFGNMKNVRFYVWIILISLFCYSCSNSSNRQISTLDTVTVMKNPDTEITCNKKLYYSPIISLSLHREIVTHNHCSNLECSKDLKHYRIASTDRQIDLYVSPVGKKAGRIHLTFLRSDSTIQSIYEKVVAIEVILDKETVNAAFHLIDSLQMDSIYVVQGVYAGYQEDHWKTHDYLSALYEYATPEVYYLQSSPECEKNNLPCMCWLEKLRKFRYYLDKLLEPYSLPIEKLKEDMAKKNILKI
jgi:hypothetical protein